MSRAGKPDAYGCRVFVSATSMDMRSARLEACRVLEMCGHEPRFQERFEHGYRRLEEFLADRISECHAVVCLVGTAFGAGPDQGDAGRRSYTQREYDVARDLGLPIFIFQAGDRFPPDPHASEPAHLVALQHAHVEALRRSHKWVEFQTLEELRERVEALASQLPRILPLVLYDHYRPAPPPFFAGRATELDQLAAAVRAPTPSVVAVVGMGGQGKTTLVDRWLREQPRLEWTRGAWISLDRPELSFDRFLDLALGFFLGSRFDKRTMPNPAARSAELVRLLQREPVLLVLDGVERWLFGWAKGSEEQTGSVDTVEMRRAQPQLFDGFLRHAASLSSGSHVVLIGRALPAALDDVACTVIPVRDEEHIEATLDGLDPDAAVQLLRRLGVRGSHDELAKVAAAYQGHPLALTVLAGLLRKLYGGRLQQLPEVNPLDPRRSLYSLLESTLKHLPAPRLAERFLAVASHALEDPPLGVLAAALSGDVGELRDLAVTLADWNVIRWDGEQQVVRIHPLVRQFAKAGLGEAELRAVHERYSDWYEGLALPPSPSSLEQVAPRLLSIEHALCAKAPERSIELIFRVVHGELQLIEWAQVLGHHSAVIELLGRVAVAARTDDVPRLLVPRAALQRQLGRLEEAVLDLNQVLATTPLGAASGPTDAYDMTGALLNRGNVLRQLSRPSEALEDYDQALLILYDLPQDDPVRLAHLPSARMNRGLALREAGRFGEAAVEYERAIIGYREPVDTGHPALLPALSLALANHAITLTEMDNIEPALRLFDEAIDIQERLEQRDFPHDVALLSHVKTSKAATLTEAGAPVDATVILDEVVKVLEPLVEKGREDVPSQLALAFLARGEAFCKRREWSRAVADSDRAIQLYEGLIARGRVDLDSWLACALLNHAEARHESGDVRQAAETRDRGLRLLEHRIACGEPETRVLYLRKSAEAARYLVDKAPAEGHAILKRAVEAMEAGLAAGETVEALQYEARRAVRLLDKTRPEGFEPFRSRLRLHAFD